MAARRAASHRQPTAGHDRRQIRRRVLQSPGWDRVHVYYSYQHEDSDFLVGDTVILVVQRYAEEKKQMYGKQRKCRARDAGRPCPQRPQPQLP